MSVLLSQVNGLTAALGMEISYEIWITALTFMIVMKLTEVNFQKLYRARLHPKSKFSFVVPFHFQWKLLKYWFKLHLALVGQKLDSVIHQVQVFQKVANAISQWISFPITHPVESLNNWGQVITIQWILKYQWLLSHYPLNPVDISCSMQRAKKVVSDSPGLVHLLLG